MAPSSKRVLQLLAMALMVATVHGCGYNCPSPSLPPPPPSPPPPSCPPSPPPPSPPPPSCPPPPPPPPPSTSCPNLDVCISVNLLGLLPANAPCCKLLAGLASADAALCLCNVLGFTGIRLDVIAFLNQCKIPCESTYTCPR